MANHQELQQQAWDEYHAHAGKIILVNHAVYYNGHGDQLERDFNPPIRVRVDKGAQACDIVRWNDEWLDPAWNITPLKPIPGLNNPWILATARNLNGETEQGWFNQPERKGILARIRSLVGV